MKQPQISTPVSQNVSSGTDNSDPVYNTQQETRGEGG